MHSGILSHLCRLVTGVCAVKEQMHVTFLSFYTTGYQCFSAVKSSEFLPKLLSLCMNVCVWCEARSVLMTDVQLKLIGGHRADQHPDSSGMGIKQHQEQILILTIPSAPVSAAERPMHDACTQILHQKHARIHIFITGQKSVRNGENWL